MNRKLFWSFVLGTVFTAGIGTLLHFVYEWTGENAFAGLLSPVNESTWEHMKLLFFPMLVFSLFLLWKFKEDYPCLEVSLWRGLLLGSFLIPVIYYTYTGVLGFHTLSLDIAAFLLSILAAFCYAYRYNKRCHSPSGTFLLRLCVLLLLAAFFVFTPFPPSLGLFREP